MHCAVLSSASCALDLSPCDPQSWLYQAVALQITYANLRQNQLIYFQNIV